MYADVLDQLKSKDLHIDLKEGISNKEKERALEALKEIASSYDPREEVDYKSILPLTEVIEKTSGEDLSILRKGEVAFVFLAGGESTRFKDYGWKGTYPVFEGKSIIELLLEKIRKIEAEKPLPVAFLVSNETRSIVEDHLKKIGDHCDIAVQDSWPILNEKKELYYRDGSFRFAPCGNGKTPYHLMENGLIEKWKKQGIKYISFLLIDNPLIDLEDPSFWQKVKDEKPDIALKAIERKPFESIGALCKRNGTIELLEAAWFAKAKEKSFDESKLQFPWGNSGFMVFSIEFLSQCAHRETPSHLVRKSDPLLGDHYRFERFLTDYLTESKKTLCFAISRDKEYASLKKGQDLDYLREKLTTLSRNSIIE